MACDLYELTGLSISDVATTLNAERSVKDLEAVGVSSVYSLFQRMKCKKSAVGKAKQGGGKSVQWALARKNLVAHWLVRSGAFDDDVKYKNLLDTHFDGTCPGDWLDREKAKDFPIDVNAIAYWDEKHFCQQIGGFGTRKFRYKFPRNKETGALDDVQGTYLSDNGDEDAILRMKYTNEFRAAFGTAVRINPETGDLEAIPLKYWEYTKCLLQYVDKCDKAYDAQRKKVKTSVGAKAGHHHDIWFPDLRPKGKIFAGDKVTELKGVGDKKAGIILNQLGFITVGDIKSNEEVMTLTSTAKVKAWLGVAKEKTPALRDVNLYGSFPKVFCAAILEAGSCIDGDAPCSIDYRKVEGCPYTARFGEVQGMVKLKEDCPNIKDIRDYVLFMVNTAKEFYSGTSAANSFKIYHDALQQFTDEKCISWMKEQGLYNYFLWPELGCNDGTAFAGRTVGDSPEFNNLDTSLFADFVHVVQRHTASTRKVRKEDPRKFSMATPITIGLVVQRIWGIRFITQRRILQDHHRIWQETLPEVLEHKGEMIPHCGERRGKRGDTATKFGGCGGFRKKGVFTHPKNACYHEDALYGLKLMKEKSNERYQKETTSDTDAFHTGIRMSDDDGFEVVFNEDDEDEEVEQQGEQQQGEEQEEQH